MIQSRELWQHRSTAFLAACGRRIEECIGSDRVASVILCGSFAAGDESIVLEQEPPILLSDVDLAVILRSFDDLARWGPRRTELGSACEALMPEVRFAGHVEVGLMLPADLRALPARPGVLDMKSHGRVIAGNASAINDVPSYGPGDITPREALILVENRIVSLLGRFPQGRDNGDIEFYRFRYEIAKVYTDIAAAALSLMGSYRSGYEERSRLIAHRARAEETLAGKLIDGNLAQRIEEWSRFKTAPSAGAVPLEARDRPPVETWMGAARDIMGFRQRAASFVNDGENGFERRFPTGRFAGAAKRPGGARDHWRSWRGYLGRISPRRAFAIACSRGAGIFTAYPDDIMREYGVRLLVHAIDRGPDTAVRRAPAGFPHRSSAWREAAREVSSGWREFVFGRAEE